MAPYGGTRLKSVQHHSQQKSSKQLEPLVHLKSKSMIIKSTKTTPLEYSLLVKGNHSHLPLQPLSSKESLSLNLDF